MGKLSPEEFDKKYNLSKIQSVKDERLGGAGSVALPNNFGESQYDSQATRTDLSNLNDFRGEVQPLSDRWANGLAKAIPNTAIRTVGAFATTLGGLWGLTLGGAYSAIDGDKDTTYSTAVASGFNNEMSQYLDGVSKSLAEQLPVYRTDEYEDADLGRIAYGGTFWADTMTDAASFMASSLISGDIITKGISSLGKGMVGFSKAKQMLSGVEKGKEVFEAGKNLGNATKSTEMWKNLAASTFGATAEAGVESRETYNTIYGKVYEESYNRFKQSNMTDEDAQEKAKTEATKQASSAANISMLINTILVGGSTFMQFGKHFTNMTDDIIDAAKVSSDGTYKGFKLATEDLSKYQKAYKKLGLLGDPATEAGQEGGQFAMSKFLENYYTGDDEERDNFLQSTVNALSETLSPDGIESMMAGAVLGGLGSAGKAFYGKKNKVKTEDDFVNEAITNANEIKLDEVMGNVFGEGSKILANQMSRSIEADKALLEAKRVNDEVGAGLIKTTDFGDFVTTRLRLGKFDEVTEYLNGIKEAETTEVDKLYNSNGSTRLTNETKSAIVDNAIEQANKIKKAYDENTRRYGRIVAEEDIAKMSIAESILDYAKVEELKAVKVLKDYDFDMNEVLSKYKTPEEMKALSGSRGVLEKTYNDIKTDIDGRKKEGNYKGERAKELESTFNELSSITKQIENSLSDASFTTPFSIDGKNQISNYKSVILKEINKKLNDIEQAAERNAGDLTEWQKLKDARDSFIKIQDIKDSIIDIRNKFTKDPQKFSREASEAVIKSKASKAYNELFRITTQPQIAKNKDGKSVIDNNTSEPMVLKPGLYYEGQGRVEGVYGKDGKQLVQDGKRVWKNIAHAKRDFYDILETFIEVDDAGRPIPMIRYVNKGKEQVVPLELFKNGVLNPVYNKGEVGGVISEGLMTEEEAFYQKYRNNVIQYQYLFKNNEGKLETKIIHGMLGYNAQGYMVVRFKNDAGFVKDTQPFRVEKRQADGTVKIKIEVSNFQVAENEKPWYSKTNSQYLKILNEEQSKEWLFADNLERTEQMYKNTLAKRKASDTTTMPFEDIILEEEKSIKNNLEKVKEVIQELDNKTKEEYQGNLEKVKRGIREQPRRAEETKSLKKAIDSMEAKVSNITSYINALENEKIRLREDLQRVNDIIAANKQSEEFYEDLATVKENLNKNRQHLIDTLEKIEQSNEAYESIKSLYYATIRDIKEQFNNIIDFDKFYESEYMSNVIASMNNPVLDVKYTNMGLVGSDFGEILNYLIDNNNKTVQFVDNRGVIGDIKLELSKVEEVGNEDLENKLAVLEETISNMGDEAIQLMAQLKNVNRAEYADADIISTYDFYKTILQRLSDSKNALTRDDTIFYGKGLKVDGYNDPFTASRREIRDAPKKSINDSISTTSRQDITPYFPNSGSNEDKHQWVFQKFLADNDLTNDYLLEYLVDDVTDTSVPYIRNKSFDTDPTQKAILVRVVDTKGNPVLFDNTGAIKPDGIYQAIGVLEGGFGMERNAGSDTATKYTKFREVDDLYKLKEDLVEEQDATKKAEIQSKITALEAEINNGLAKYQEVRDKIVSVLDKGERFVTKPIEQSLGVKFEGKEELELKEAFGENFKQRIKKGELVLDVVREPEYTLPTGDKINVRVGTVLIYENSNTGSIKTPKVYFLQPKKNNDYNLNKIVENIKKFAVNEELKADKFKFDKFYDIVRRYVYWGSVNDINKEYKGKTLDETTNETDEELKDKLYHIRFKYGSDSQIVEFGDYIGKDAKGKPLYDIKEISVKDIEGNEEFSKFIKSKNNHFSVKTLDKNLVEGITETNSPLATKLNGFTVNTQRSDKLKYKSQYVRGSNEQVESLKEKKKPVVPQPPTQQQLPTNTDNIYSDLNIKGVNKAVELSNTLSYKEGVEQIKLWFESGVLKQNEGVSKQNFEDVDAFLEKAKQLDENGNYNGVYVILTGYKKEVVVKDGVDEGSTETTKYEFESINALNRLLQALVSNKFVSINETLITKPQQTATEKAIAIINNSQEAEPDIDPEAYMRKNHNLDAEPKLRIKDIRSLKDLNRYYGLTPKFIKGLIDGVGFGKIAQVAEDLKITVSQDAPLFAEYHEKFHLVELFLFNQGERAVIYDWFRKSFKNNNLTDKEVSEMMAEEFRYYSIERAAKENKTFGEMIFDYLRKIIDGLSQLFTYNSDPNIKSLFDAIYDETVSSDLFRDTNVYDKNKVYGLGENFLQKQPFTREEIKSLQKHSLLAYYTELEKNIPNFSRFSFLVDGEYTKEVKEQYKEKMDVFQQFDNADTAILFNVLSSIEVANPYIAAKLSSYENKIDLAKNIKDYIDIINQNGIDIDEFIKETINEEYRSNDTAWDLEPTGTDFIKGGSSIVNMLLTTIPGDKNHLGLTEHIDINQSKVELHYLLKDIKNGAELLQKLKTSTTYWHNVLYSRLTDPRKDKAGNVVTVLDRNVAMMQVVTNFKKQIINFVQTNVKEDGVVTLIDKNRDSLLQRELYNFRNKFIFEHGITPNDYKNDAKVIELKNQLEKLKSLDGHHFLNSLGFDVDVEFEQYARENNINISNIIQKIKTYDLSKTDDFKSLLKDSSKVTRIKELAQIITDYKNEVTPVQVLSADNKPMYSIIERNFISKKLDELKRKFEGNDSIEAQRINDAEIVYNLGVSTENDVQKANKLTETPSFIMHINNILHNISPFIATGDKSSYFGFKNLAKVYSQPIVEEEINDRYISLYKNILEQEFNTFVKYKSADSDMVMPLIDQHFGVSSVFNPSIDKVLFVDGALRFTDFSSFYNSDNFKEGFEKAIIEYTEKKVESLTKKLYDSGIAEGDKINFVDKESLRQTSTYSGYDLAHKLHLFILESNYMQSKYMIGDIGFYGMNLNKRVPTAMATKKDGNYNVAVAGLLKNHPVYGRKAKFDFNKTIDGELVFDALVHDDLFFKDEKLEKLFSKYGQTNIADGAAMEHIESIRFREWSEGTWTQADEDLYQLDLDDKLGDASLVKFTMKKTQYFGDTVHKLSKDSADTITVPTLYKMAVIPITNSIASKSKTLRDIKKMMEDNQILLLMADSANKITRKVETKGNGYKLFNENSEVSTDKDNINKYKQTSFWKYYNTQQDTHKDEKWEQTQGTQFSKQIFANILEGAGILTSIESGDVTNAKDTISNIDNLNVARVALAKELLYERFDISKEKGGNKTASTKALLKEIKVNLQQKDVPSTMIEEVIELLSNNKGLDTVLNSTSFEAVLTSLVNKMLIQPKKFGMPMAQAANIGFTQMEFSQEESSDNIVKLNEGHDLPPLKAYIEGESEGLEVYLPSYLKEQIDISKVDSKLLKAIGFRIPTQSPNSIEKIIIKGFLPSNFGNMVIVPSSITTKSGSDFDIDKINIYLPNYYTNAGGWSTYVPVYTNNVDFDAWFETLDTKESKNSLKMKAIDNGIFENYLTILDSKEYRKQMLTPNSDKRIREVSDEMRNREFKEKTSLADLMTIEHHIEAKQAAQLGKNILGQVALHSTHHILSQIANINISTNVPIFEGLKKLHTDGVVNLDLFRDTKGTLISDTISELVNASVDVLKDPYIKYSEITEHNTGTFLYLLRTGVPLEDVVYFFNNPVIRTYNKMLAKRQFNSTDYNSKLHSDIIKDLRANFGKIESLGILGSTLLKSRALADNIDYTNNMDYTVLNQFDQYFQTATALNDLMRTTKFDTSGMGTSFGETKGIVDSYNGFMAKNDKARTNKINNVKNIFERDGVKTTMGVYRDVVSEAVSYFDSLYTSTMNNKIVANINELFKTVKSDKQTQAYNRYISDFAAYVTQNYNDFPEYLHKNITVTEVDEKTKLKTTKTLKSVANEIERIKKSKTDPLSKNLFLNTIVTDTKEAFHKVLLLKGSSNNTNKYYSEQLSDSFTELMSYDAKLGYDIIKLAIMQDGFNLSPFSYLHLIPIEYKMELLDTFYTISDNIDLGNFDTKFKLKNHTLAFSGAKYFRPEKFSSAINGYMVGQANKLGERSIFVKIDNKSYEIENGNIKELDMMIGRSITDYVSTPIESKPLTVDDLITNITDRYKKLEPKNCN